MVSAFYLFWLLKLLQIKMCKHNVTFFSIKFREDFKFFSQMDEIFRRELKMDGSVADMLVTDEPDDCTLVPPQKKGEN